jgi:hypothetical protein
MRFQVYPRGIWIAIDDFTVAAIEASMSGETMIVHAPGLQFAVTNGAEFIETDAFARDFIEMSPQRWIRTSAITSIKRFGDEYARVMLQDVRQCFDIFPGDNDLFEVYQAFRVKLPLGAPAFTDLDSI